MPQLRKRQTPPKNSVNEVRNCFICRKDTSIFCENLFKIKTKHSDTAVLKYIDKFLGYTLVKDESFKDLIICKCCMTKIDEFDKAYKTAKLVQNELKELLYVSVQSIKITSIPISTEFVMKIDADDDQQTYSPADVQTEELIDNDDVKLEIEILDTDENYDETETYIFDMDDSKIECLDEYQMIEERIRDDEEFFESCISDSEEIHLKSEEFDFGDCITMTCDICNTSFKR